MPIYHSILIIKPGAIGDLLQMEPVIRELTRQYPHARITMLVGSRVTAELFRHHPHVAETILFDRKGEHRSVAGLSRLWRRIRGGGYDLVLNFQRSNVKNWILVSAAFPCRVLIYHKSRKTVIHAVADHLKTLAPLGISSDDLGLEFFTSPQAELSAERLFRENDLTHKKVVALNPGASHPVNRWDPRQFAQLADRLAEESGINVMVIGGKEDLPLAEKIAAFSRSRLLLLTGKTTLSELGSILKRCDLLVSGDTGPMHLASAVGTRVVALFGAADPVRTGPVGEGDRVIQSATVACVPCRSRNCANPRYLECMEKIAVDEVYEAVTGFFEKRDGP